MPFEAVPPPTRIGKCQLVFVSFVWAPSMGTGVYSTVASVWSEFII